MFCTFLTFSYFINHDKLFIHVQCDHKKHTPSTRSTPIFLRGNLNSKNDIMLFLYSMNITLSLWDSTQRRHQSPILYYRKDTPTP